MKKYSYVASFSTLEEDITKGQPIAPNLSIPSQDIQWRKNLTGQYGWNIKENPQVRDYNLSKKWLTGLREPISATRTEARNILSRIKESSLPVSEDVSITPIPDDVVKPMLANIERGNRLFDEKNQLKGIITDTARKYSRTPFNKAIRSGGLFSYVGTI